MVGICFEFSNSHEKRASRVHTNRREGRRLHRRIECRRFGIKITGKILIGYLLDMICYHFNLIIYSNMMW